MKRNIVLLLFLATLYGCVPMNNSSGSSDGSGISLRWEMYPNPRKATINPGEEIIFKLSSITTTSQAHMLTMVFGDGTSGDAETSCVSKGTAAYQCSPVHFSHIYNEDNFYHPYVKFERGMYPGDPIRKETSFIISPVVKTDEELKELAFNDSVQKFQEGIKEVVGKRNPEKIRFALTSSRNANFEYGKSEADKRDIAIVKKLTTALVNDGFSVLEKNPQSLIRLAHESIVKKDSSGRPTDEYQDSLEYGLRTEYSDPSHPFVYGEKD